MIPHSTTDFRRGSRLGPVGRGRSGPGSGNQNAFWDENGQDLIQDPIVVAHRNHFPKPGSGTMEW